MSCYAIEFASKGKTTASVRKVGSEGSLPFHGHSAAPKLHLGASSCDFLFQLEKSNHCQYITDTSFDNNDQLQLCFSDATLTPAHTPHFDYCCTPLYYFLLFSLFSKQKITLLHFFV